MVDPQGQHIFRFDRSKLRELNERLEGLGNLKRNRDTETRTPHPRSGAVSFAREPEQPESLGS